MNNFQSVEALFKPFEMGNLKLSNRILMAPMTRNFSPNGVPGEDVAAYYRRRAENGVGLIVTEGMFINHPDVASEVPAWQEDVPHLYGEEALNGWSKVVDGVHEAGGKIFSQLWHMGARGNANDYSKQEILELVEAFAQAAADAKKVGFDGIEIMAAHGFLIDQFFWEKTNARTDEYGGDIVKRTRFAREAIAACRRVVGPDFPISLRISQWKYDFYTAKLVETPEELKRFLTPLVDAGVDIFHASIRRFWEPAFEGSELNLSGWIKKLTGKPTITVGSVGLDGADFVDFFATGEEANGKANKMGNLIERLEREEFDLIAVGRALLADPDWVNKIRDGRTEELIPFTREAIETLY
ncbi:NADH:flavin oxidoreductase [Bacillus halotolerans]|uniref:NADH:flavin oxidoreductase n=1 Tax=Bacillus halotolerans TaxID=260554 RepID=UPI002DBE1830|nr:NADH:flavin oxidoreductase [Bacillus halotolerans]MEC1604580.1 NADH:flavin oxidoreductase [Bacillus halotolerans]